LYILSIYHNYLVLKISITSNCIISILAKKNVDWCVEQLLNPKREETPMDKWFRAMHSAQTDPYGIDGWKKRSIACHPEWYR
jgi:hypothetical protein